MDLNYTIVGGDFSKAGQVSSEVKRLLKEQGVVQRKIKKTVIALYEAEVNVVAHAFSADVEVHIDNEKIIITINDTGPGIEDIDRAMAKGFSTASAEVIEMGFGAGMGLANIKKNSDKLEITSQPGKWTKVIIMNYL